MQLSTNFYSAIYALFQIHLPTLKTWQLDKFVNKYPQYSTDLVTMIESQEAIQRKYVAFSRVRAGRENLATLKQLIPEMKLLGIETLDVTYGMDGVDVINFKRYVYNFVMDTALNFERLSPEELKTLSIEYCSWMLLSMKALNMAVGGANSLKNSFTLNRRHVDLLNRMSAERFADIMKELNMEIFANTSRAAFLEFIFNFKSNTIIAHEEQEEKNESDAYPDLLKMLVSAKKDQAWEFINKHNFLSEISNKNNYITVLSRMDAQAFAYHLAKNRGAITVAALQAQPEAFKAIHNAFCTLLNIVQPLLDLINQNGSANINTAQEKNSI